MSRKAKYFAIFLCSLLLINVFILVLSFQVLPNNGGFSRQILFIKPDDTSAGYFIILDELTPNAQKHDIDWVLHTRGNGTLSPNFQSYTSNVGSYISSDNISLNVTFLEPIKSIELKTGYFVPNHYYEPYPYDDLETPYIKATYSGSENPIMATVLYPKNDTDLSQAFPVITPFNTGLKKIGSSDFLFYADSMTTQNFPEINVNFTGQLFFIRFNATADIEYFYLQGAEGFSHLSVPYFQSDSPLENLIVSYVNSTQISGLLTPSTESTISLALYVPFLVETVEIDGTNHTYTQNGSIVSFTIDDSCSFVVSATNDTLSTEYNPLRDPTPTRNMPQASEYGFNITLIQALDHPYILYTQDYLINLQNKFYDSTKDWNSWYTGFISGVDSINNATDYDQESLYYYVYKLALKYSIDGGYNYLTKLIEFLRAIGAIDHFSQDLERSYAVQAFSLAFDMVYNNLSIADQSELQTLLYNQALPLMQMDLYPENNHRVVDAGALGVAGLVLKDASMVNKALETILNYFYTFNPPDGGSFEGYSYNSFAVEEFLCFATGLKRLDGFNFYNDSQILATFDFMAETLGPLGMPSLYEDCTFSSRLQECLLIAAANMNDTYPERAQHYQYIWEARQNNTLYQPLSDSYYTYLNGGWSSFRRLLCYNVNETIEAAPFETRREIWKASGMAFLRSEDAPDSLFFSFNCKPYAQSHVHYDENSFEIWAYGAYLVNNPGYPGFGETYHDWTISSEASNTILIDGSEQLQETTNGLLSSISSPYFTMVTGDAEATYTDHGAWLNAPEHYLLLLLNISLISLAFISFLYFNRKTRNTGMEQPTHLEVTELSKTTLLKMSFTHPCNVQDYLAEEDPPNNKGRFLNRTVILIFSGLTVAFYLVLILDILSMVNYHLQYYEEGSQSLVDILNIAKIFLLSAGPPLTFLSGLLAISIYSRFNRLQIKIALANHRLEVNKKRINAISTASIMWFIPILVFSFLLLYFTTASSFKGTIHRIFVGSGALIFIYEEVTLLLREFIRNIFIILLASIPSLFICLKTFSHGVAKTTDGAIPRKRAAFISLTSYSLLITMFFVLVSLLFLGVKLVISLVGIETFISP